MKKKQWLLFVVFVIFLSIPAAAAEYSIGVMGWYSWWNSSALEDGMRGKDNGLSALDPLNRTGAYGDTFSSSPALMIGPSVGVSFMENWTLNVVFLAGMAYDLESHYYVDNIAPAYTMQVLMDYAVKRYDLDATLGYGLNSYLTIFAGLKYLQWRAEGTWNQTDVPGNIVDLKTVGHMFGPGLGLKLTMPLWGSLYFTASFSGIVVSSWRNEESFIRLTGITETKDVRQYTYGYNSFAGLSYFVDALSSVIALGFRYQDVFSEDDAREQIFGPVVSVVYSF